MRDEVPQGPNMFRGIFLVNEKPKDTYLDMTGWTKGVCFVNGHNLGRYWDIGPQETLYLPAPWLHPGENEVRAFPCLCVPAFCHHCHLEPIVQLLKVGMDSFVVPSGFTVVAFPAKASGPMIERGSGDRDCVNVAKCNLG